jgi:hypothetical protein
MRSAHPDARQSPEQMSGTEELSRENQVAMLCALLALSRTMFLFYRIIEHLRGRHG